MKISTFFYAIKQGLINIIRNFMFSIASIATMTACIFLFGLFFAILVNFDHTVKKAEEEVPITVFFTEETTSAEKKSLEADIRAQEEVKELIYVSAEEAWESYKYKYFADNPELADSFAEDNPLAQSDHFEIYVKEIEKQNSMVSYIEGLKGIRDVKVSKVAVNLLTNFNVLVGTVSVGIITILLAISIFLISNTITIGISVRKEEIAIMKYIGATDFFVRAPFVVEGIIIGLFGAIIPLVILFFSYRAAMDYVSTRFNNLTSLISFLPESSVFSTLVPISLLLGVGIGFLGSILTTHKHIRV